MTVLYNTFMLILVLLVMILLPIATLISILAPIMIIACIPICRYYSKRGEIKMKADNEICINDVKFEYRNILEE